MIEYEVVPNALTIPQSFTLRIRSRGVITAAALYQEIADEVALDPATVQAVLDGTRRVTSRRLLEGDTVSLPGIAHLTAQIAERLDSPTQPLSDAATKGIRIQADIEQINAIKTQGRFNRVEAANLAPSIVTVKALGGASLQSLAAGNLVEIEGERLKINPAIKDEGIFFISPTGAAIRMTEYTAKGSKTTQFFVAAGLAPATEFSIEARTRRNPKGRLHASRWPTPVKTAP